jgi:crotonobetaine/carnitine-CoA ligase
MGARTTARTRAWSGVPRRTVIELVTAACKRDPDRAAIIFEDGLVVTRGDLLTRAERFAAYLSEWVSVGDRVAIMLENRAEFMIAWLAVMANRATLVALNPQAREADAGHILRDSQPVMAIVGEISRPLIEGLRAECPGLRQIVVVNDAEPDGLHSYAGKAQRLSFDEVDVDLHDIANIYYTSGSTGVPKGCMLDHEYWARFGDVLVRLYGFDRDARTLCPLQFFYADPSWLLVATLHTGGSLVVMRKFSVSRYWDVVRTNDVTHLFGIGSIPSLLLRAPASPKDRHHRVKLAVQVGVPASLHQELVTRWGAPWVDAYGLTESGPNIAMPLEFAEEMIGSGSIGLPCPEVEVRIVDDEDRDVVAGDPGEIVLRAPGLMRGYLNRPDATAEMMRGGWLHTGDIGRLDTRGFVYLQGRKKDIVRRGGENVSAAEVESVLRSHPGILDVAVVAVPDWLRGEEVKAYVVLAEGITVGSVPPQQLVQFCAGRLAPFKIPRYIEYRTTDFPRTPSMRVDKKRLLDEQTDLIGRSWDREQHRVRTNLP